MSAEIEFDGANLFNDYLTFQRDGDLLIVVFTCTPDGRDGFVYIDKKLENGEVVYFLHQAFAFSRDDILNIGDANIYVRRFKLGVINESGYYVVPARILGLEYDLLIHKSVKLRREMFVPLKSRVKVFKKIEDLTRQQIVIGGDNKLAVPGEEFYSMISAFPTAIEVSHYIDSRIGSIIESSFSVVADPLTKYRKYLESRLSKLKNKKQQPLECLEMIRGGETEKYRLIWEHLKQMLVEERSISEKDWERQLINVILLIYPKYIKVLHSVNFTVDAKKRQLDLMLLDADGNIDILELKKPMGVRLLAMGLKRKNYIPSSELSAAIMQSEKYLYLLKRGGAMLERQLNKKYKAGIPSDITIKITNPKALVIIGRTDDFNTEERQDYEIIRRKYMNIVDIVSYDDLLARIDNVIKAFES